MDFGPAHSFGQGAVRVVILLILVPGFFATIGVGFCLTNRWFGPLNQGYNKMAGLPLGIAVTVYALAAFVLMQLW
jgi:hypothetical protein